MTLEELKIEKLMLEKALTSAVGDMLHHFKERTDVYPNHVSVNLINVRTIGDTEDKYVLGDVSVEISL